MCYLLKKNMADGGGGTHYQININKIKQIPSQILLDSYVYKNCMW